MSARLIDSRAPAPPGTVGQVRGDTPVPIPAQARLRSRADRAGSTTLLARQPSSTWKDDDGASEWFDADVQSVRQQEQQQQQQRQLLQTLHARLAALGPPLGGRLDDIVDLFASLKLVEQELKAVLVHHAPAPELARLRHSLSLFIGHVCTAVHATGAGSRIDPADLCQAQIQRLCQGLSTCVPPGAGRLLDPDLLRQDRTSLQGLTNMLLTRAMALGLPDAVQANGEVLDVLNWVSRGLKAGLLQASDAIDLCFEKSLALMEAWTGGDQCGKLLSDHNLGRCAVQLSTMLKHTTLDLDLGTGGQDALAVQTNGRRLQRCILNLCASPVLDRLAARPVDTVSLVNVCNTVKDAIDRRLLAHTDPALLPALDRLIGVIAGLPDGDLIGVDEDCRALSNFANFLRTVAEGRLRQTPVFQAGLPMLESAACRLAGCINGERFALAWPDSQSLSNLVSFVKLCHKFLAHRARSVTTAGNTAGNTTSTSASVTAMLTREALANAGSLLTASLLAHGPAGFGSPKALGGLIAGLVYLWAHNLAPRAPAMRQFAVALLQKIGKIAHDDWDHRSRGVVLPVLQALLRMQMVTLDAALPALGCLMPKRGSGAAPPMQQDLAREIRRLGVAQEAVEPPPHPAVTPAPAVFAPLDPVMRKVPRAIPGLTAIRKATATATAPSFTPQTTASASTASTTGDPVRRVQQFQHPRKAAKRARPTSTGTACDAAGSSAEDMAGSSERAVSDPPVASPGPAADQPGQVRRHKGRRKPKKAGPGRAKAGAASARAQCLTPYTALCEAIAQGSTGQVQALMARQAAWTPEAVAALLTELMGKLEWMDSGIRAALGIFFSAVVESEPKTGRHSLVFYFMHHRPRFSGLLALLSEKNLLPDWTTLRDPALLLIAHADNPENDIGRFIDVWFDKQALNSATDRGENLLHQAAMRNYPRIVERVLRTPHAQRLAGAPDADLRNPLMLAAGNGHAGVVRLLLGYPGAAAHACAVDRQGCNALVAAVTNDSADIVRLLLAAVSTETQIRALSEGGRNTLMMALVQHRPVIFDHLWASWVMSPDDEWPGYGPNLLFLAAMVDLGYRESDTLLTKIEIEAEPEPEPEVQ